MQKVLEGIGLVALATVCYLAKPAGFCLIWEAVEPMVPGRKGYVTT